jgi:hypothetical protein
MDRLGGSFQQPTTMQSVWFKVICTMAFLFSFLLTVKVQMESVLCQCDMYLVGWYLAVFNCTRILSSWIGKLRTWRRFWKGAMTSRPSWSWSAVRKWVGSSPWSGVFDELGACLFVDIWSYFQCRRISIEIDAGSNFSRSCWLSLFLLLCTKKNKSRKQACLVGKFYCPCSKISIYHMPFV